MGGRHQGGAPVAPHPAAPVLASFIAGGRHRLPSGHLMSLHEVNVAFGQHLRSTTDVAVPMGLAASLLWEWGPELFDAMRAQAPNGNRPRRLRESVAT